MINTLGNRIILLAYSLGDAAFFASRALIRAFGPQFSWRKIIAQIYAIGVRSVPVIFLVSLFTGMVLGLEGYNTLKQFGTEGLVGTAVALSLIRELGPVLTSLMVIGQAGSTMAAELGVMRNSEQIDALDTMDINPLGFLIGPRLIAGILCFPLLTSIFNLVGIFGGYVSTVILLDVDPGTYWFRAMEGVDWDSIVLCYGKSVAFAVTTLLICCYRGYNLHLNPKYFGARGVNAAATSAVVLSSIATLALDYVITAWNAA